MPVHIEKLTSDMLVQEGGAGLSPAQIERIVAIVIARLEERARDAKRAHAATALCRQASRPLDAGH